MTEHRHGQSRFRELVGAELSVPLAGILLDWIDEAHKAAADMDQRRLFQGPRGPWNNPASYGTDRHQFLVATAEHLPLELPQIRPSAAQKPHLLHIGAKCSVYQFHAPGNSPHGPLLNNGEFQRVMAEPEAVEPELTLFTKAECWLEDRELLLVPWAEDVNRNLAQVWVGQGARGVGETIEWTWLHPLRDVLDEEGAGGDSSISSLEPPSRSSEGTSTSWTPSRRAS